MTVCCKYFFRLISENKLFFNPQQHLHAFAKVKRSMVFGGCLKVVTLKLDHYVDNKDNSFDENISNNDVGIVTWILPLPQCNHQFSKNNVAANELPR